ncbi:hypothetical protein ANRL4_04961 [Anaerolineae bacterium]|nr:hypothetical protein ANRL4_04961 [Anaerolineae bacterium]
MVLIRGWFRVRGIGQRGNVRVLGREMLNELKDEGIISSMQRKKFRIPRKKITEFCKRWNVTEFAMFGSVLRDDFRPDSDIDVLVSIDPRAHIGLFELADMKIELQNIFKRPVDLVEKEGLRNPYRRKEILRTAQVVYAA